MTVNGHATEDGILETEEWEAIQPGPGHAPLSKHNEMLWDRVSDEIDRPNHTIVTVHPPERPE